MPRAAILSEPERPASFPILIPTRIWDDLDSYDKNLQSKFIRAFRHISHDLGHPSLHFELVKIESLSIYRARVDPKHRIHFEFKGNSYLISAIGGYRLQGIG